jgi:hypothetical protein
MPVPVAVAHDINCDRARRTPLGGHSDAAKRVSDTYRLHKIGIGNQAIGQWFAARLADGTTDNVLYGTKRAAVRHQHHNEVYFAFVCIGPGDMSPCEADEFLALNRMLYDKGIRMTDPDDVKGGREIVQRSTVEDQRSLVRSIASGGRIRPSGLVYPGE